MRKYYLSEVQLGKLCTFVYVDLFCESGGWQRGQGKMEHWNIGRKVDEDKEEMIEKNENKNGNKNKNGLIFNSGIDCYE